MAVTSSNDTGNRKKVRWYLKLRNKYRLVILNEESFEEKLSFKVSRLNAFVVIGMLAIVLIFFTIYLIAFTGLREYIPGYSNASVQRNLYELQLKADSIETALKSSNLYIENMKKILSGDVPESGYSNAETNDTTNHFKYSNINISRSPEDSMLRLQYEEENRYLLNNQVETLEKSAVSLNKMNFFTPIKGIVTNHFDASRQHFGLDLAAPRNEAVKAAYDGVVFFSEWTAETGNVLAIQHPANVITVYKHNSVLLRKQGAFVRAGETISIIGNSGELSTGPHLHFEIWINGTAVDPEKFMSF
ncbi:MAG: M23 family metallopeptidase [Lentimicrobium sp.]|jgi:murein DD-endopeptidase MepM/ murein hydrolase activator NlpD|nr:M23 family metallopeptidase [Lentimicrobium sp.]